MRILGIDPGSLATGFGIVERSGDRLVHVAHGTVRTQRGASVGQRLAVLHGEIARLAVAYEPDVAAVEQVFLAASARSALVLGQARGAVLAALGAAGLPIHELAAREIKKGVVGTGAASKLQVQTMVAELLALDVRPAADAADALACAICHANANRLLGLGVRSSARRGRRRSRASFVPRPAR